MTVGPWDQGMEQRRPVSKPARVRVAGGEVEERVSSRSSHTAKGRKPRMRDGDASG